MGPTSEVRRAAFGPNHKLKGHARCENLLCFNINNAFLWHLERLAWILNSDFFAFFLVGGAIGFEYCYLGSDIGLS